jgi:RNA polymerase sigma factor (sigma-70 family)
MRHSDWNLTREEEARLIALGQAGDLEARNRVILGIYDLIWKYCLKITSNRVWMAEDYVHVAIATLCEKFDKFELGRGLRYSTYAMYWVDQTVKMHLMKYSRLIRVPIYHQRSGEKFTSAQEHFYEDANRANNVTRLTIEHAADLADHREEERMIHADDVRTFLQKSLRFLRDKEQEVARLRWQGKTLDEIGRQMKLTRGRIQQIERSAYRKIKQFAPKIDPVFAEEMECVA